MNAPPPGPQPHRRLPEWLRRPLPTSVTYGRTHSLLRVQQLHTVCESAQCPNHWECWSRGTAAFMIAGDLCTRRCAFCSVRTGRALPLDADEPARIAEAVRRLKLRHVVLTAVARDDLPDGGAEHFRQTMVAIRAVRPEAAVEVLVPDFNDCDASLDTVLAGQPAVFNHNLETVRRLTPRVRSRASYDRSLSVLRKVKARCGDRIYTKSGLMLGLGETEAELFAALADLRGVGCDMLTLGQYLQPTRRQLPVAEYIPPAKFQEYGERARELGFTHVASAPMVRSSYHSGG